ncbi:hypothetical protein KKC83_03035 [Patescibacteria group bacterium]|nr:hypothetical protein [Candidatus Falkowbacteria bacterium]MBU3905716.1 hypothetical protein [Patescibacteria group bacterium]MBU4014955.1 hypothetical protein [Patescibacteria group bacterium]MBU4026490.1 hypothetical protein [Patescibacteria group bacterium]MBU4072701.1 hypothetical protein [Patescibacteria group bacterium]
MEITIKTLNKKWWYRLLKICYIFCFLTAVIIFLFGVYFIFVPIKTFDNNKSYILCDNERKFNLEENNILLGSNGYISLSNDKKFKLLCSYDPNDPTIINNGKISFSQLMFESKIAPKTKNYQLISFYKSVGNLEIAFLYLFTGLFVILITFEIIKRIFYYVLLGSVNPNK